MGTVAPSDLSWRLFEPSKLGKAGTVGSAAAAATLLALALYAPPSSWLLEYYPNRGLAGVPSIGQLRSADFDVSEATLPVGFPDREDFSLRLRSCLRVPAEGRFVFRIQASDGARLFVDDDLIIDAWDDGARSGKEKALVLDGGSHPITIEYFNARGSAGLTIEMAQRGSHDFRSLKGRTQRPTPDGVCDAT